MTFEEAVVPLNDLDVDMINLGPMELANVPGLLACSH